MARGRIVTVWVAVAAAAAIAGCGGGRSHATSNASTGPPTATTAAASKPPPPPPPPPFPVALHGAHMTGLMPWTPAMSVAGHVAAWVKRVDEAGSTVTLARFDQSYVTLALHAGAGDPGGTGWRYGPAVGPVERRHLVAAFNGGFRLSTGAGGFVSYGRVGAPLQFGGASVVTYTDGTSDVGAWREGVPAPGHSVASVRQTLQLMINHGQPTAAAGCGVGCWGATLGGAAAVARSAIGVTAGGRLIWAGGEGLTVQALANALLAGGAERAMELDINPEWVNGFLYGHPGVVPLPLVPGQTGGADMFLTADGRDFFTVLARS